MEWTWIITAISLSGTIINIYKHSSCFVLWLISNTAWCAWNFHIGQIPLACQFGVYVILSIIGLTKWRKEEKEASDE